MKTENMIPKAYMQSADMRTLCRIFDLEFDLLKYQTDHILDCYSPEHCLEHLLPELAEHIGFAYNEKKQPMYNRVVLKHFIKDLIRYRGSSKGIANAAAIDVRYRMVYPTEKYNLEQHQWVPEPRAGETIDMVYHEAIPVERTWIDVDNPNGIIYLFVVASDYFNDGHGGKSNYYHGASIDQDDAHRDRMLKLLDLAYLQEYVRPAGMYLLPMVAEKVNAHTDLTVKAVRIPKEEYDYENGVYGSPNASQEHRYDRIHFATVEDRGYQGGVNTEPWIRTLYHSQVAGNLTHKYFSKPVYHIEGKFLYYDHNELMSIYEDIMREKTGGMKVGDALYNPYSEITTPPDYSYGPDPSNEPENLIDQGRWNIIESGLLYEDSVFSKSLGSFRIYQQNLMDLKDNRYYTSPYGNMMVVYVPEPVDSTGQPIDNDYHVYLYADDATLPIDNPYRSVIPDFFSQGHPDDGTNRNFVFNLFQLDEDENSPYTGRFDIGIQGKEPIPDTDRYLPYATPSVSIPDGTNMVIIVHSELEITDDNHDLYIP